MGWGAGTAQGRYADVFCYGMLLTKNTTEKQSFFESVALYADFSLGLNPMGISFYTGLGTDQPVSPLQLDSYYTKYGVDDGVSHPNHGNRSIGLNI